MAKARANSEEWKSDDLEIISIGTIYTGPWDKKYWSSSRGKDRYPYPVGYKAVRAHNGGTYKMEIQEGPKGPVFLIMHSTESCIGQTPDIAWGKFQKTGFSHPKIWHENRSTCKMDGVEFFGLKNPLVQRLLRELVANTYGAAESSVIIPSSSNGPPEILDDEKCPVVCAYPNLLPKLDMSVPRKKRSRRSEIACQKSVGGSNLKRPRPRNLLCGGEIANSAPTPSCSTKRKSGIAGLQGKEISPERLHLNCVPKEDPCISIKNPHHVRVVAPLHAIDKLPESCESKPVSNFYEEDTKDEVAVSKAATEDRQGDASVLKESQNMTDANLCAPDTLDFLQDNTPSSALNAEDDKTCRLKEELTTENMLVSEGLVDGPHVELTESGLNTTLKSSDSDPADQEIAKSMIKLLLPQAIPLLKKATDGKQMKNNISGTSLFRLSPAKSGKGSPIDDVPVSDILNPQAVSLYMKACNVDDENSHLVAPDSDIDPRDPEIRSIISIIPDSFDESHLDISGSDHILSSPKEPYPEELDGLPIIEERVAKPNMKVPVSDLETCRSRDFSSYHDVHTILDANIEENHLKKSVSVPQCTSPMKRISIQESQELYAEAGGKSLQRDVHSGNKDPKNTLDSIEGKGSGVNATPAEVGSIKQEKYKVYTRRRVSIRQEKKNRNLSSENVGGNFITISSPMKIPPVLELQPVISANRGPDKIDLGRGGISHEQQQSQSFELGKMNDKCTNQSNYTCLSPKAENIQAMELPSCSNVKLHKDVKVSNKLTKTVELLGCYFHPMPISSVLLKSVANEIYICVVSYPTADRFRNLFVYKISAKEPAKGCPSFIGHTPVILPSVDDKSSRHEALERSGLHFTPDGRDLILCGDIKTPYCREGKINCLCITCTSAGFEENTVRIVQVKIGHVSLVTQLKAVENVQCTVVCHPNYLIAVERSGKLIVWVMNPSWRVPVEEFIVPNNPCVSSCIVELKQIPKCPYLVIGHNGVGEFTIWDISKRILVSRFLSPNNSVCEFIPISLFARNPILSHSTMEDHIDGILAATKLWFSKHVDSNALVPTEGKNVSVWLLISTASDPDAESVNCGETPKRCWRLALLMKNAVIYGQQLDPRASAAGAMSGHGILGTHDGLVYLWDLSTGAKLGSLHNFQGHSVSCISRDDSTLCIASDEGQLLVYRHSASFAPSQNVPSGSFSD